MAESNSCTSGEEKTLKQDIQYNLTKKSCVGENEKGKIDSVGQELSLGVVNAAWSPPGGPGGALKN